MTETRPVTGAARPEYPMTDLVLYALSFLVVGASLLAQAETIPLPAALLRAATRIMQIGMAKAGDKTMRARIKVTWQLSLVPAARREGERGGRGQGGLGGYGPAGSKCRNLVINH